MVRFIGMVGQPRRNFTKMASWSRTSEHLVNPIGMSDQLKWNNHYGFYSNKNKPLLEKVYELYGIKKKKHIKNLKERKKT